MEFTQVMQHAKEGGIDSARALLNIPVLKFQFADTPERKQSIETVLHQRILGDNYDDYINHKSHVAALEQFGESLVEKQTKFSNAEKHIEQSIVSTPTDYDVVDLYEGLTSSVSTWN